MTFMLPSDDRNTYRDFRLPFLDRLKMLAEALPDDQRPLVDRAILELGVQQVPYLPEVKLLAGPSASPVFPSHEKAVEEFTKPIPALTKLIEKSAAPKPKKKSPKK